MKYLLPIVFSLFPSLLSAQTPSVPMSPHIITTGHAELDIAADMANLHFSVVVQDKDSLRVRQLADAKVATFVSRLEKVGLNTENFSAGGLRLEPEYQSTSSASQLLIGYKAIRDVRVSLYQLDRISSIIDAAFSAGLSKINSIEYGVKERKTYEAKVRDMAIINSQRRAKELAKAYGSTLGKIYSITYNGNSNVSDVIGEADGNAALKTPEVSFMSNKIHFVDNIQVVFFME